MQLLYYNSAFFFIFLILLFVRKAHALSKSCIALWLFGSINTIIYAAIILNGYTEFDIWPVLFLELCIAIYIFPLYKIEIRNFQIPYSLAKNIEYLMLLLGVLSLLPFIEHLIYMFQTFSVASNSIVDMYEDKMEGKSNLITWLDPLAYFFYGIVGNFRYTTAFFLFILCCVKRHIEKWKLCLYCIAVLTPIVGAINTSGRGTFFFFLLTFLILFFMMRKEIKVKIPRIMKIIFLTIISVFVSVITLITTLRNEGSDYNAWIWSTLYFGEGQVNFFDSMWNIKTFTEGDNSFSYFKHILGLNTFIDFLDRREFWHIGKTGVDPVRFYTFIGDWFSDIGYFTILLILTMSITIYHIAKRNRWTVLNLYFLYIYCYIIFTSFTCYSLKTYFATYQVVLGAILIFIMSKVKLKTR